jgi:membrane-bound lytic murein transglycosylase MltF
VKTPAPAALRELTWANVYQRADLGVRAILVKLKDCDRRLQQLGTFTPGDRMAFCDAAYNGGDGGMQQDRRLCGLKKGCDPFQWFGHVELTSAKSRAKWQGYGLSAFDINRQHVDMTTRQRRPKYVLLLGV